MQQTSWSKIQLIALGLWFGAAIFILFISFMSASRVYSGDSFAASRSSLYWGTQLLPDHILYPISAGFDRLQLQLSPAKSRPLIQVALAYRRLAAAEALVQKGKKNIALSTLTKSIKYMNQAGHVVLSSRKTDITPNQMQSILAQYEVEYDQLTDQFNEEDGKSLLLQLETEMRGIQETLDRTTD